LFEVQRQYCTIITSSTSFFMMSVNDESIPEVGDVNALP
jgi:hypothetical protein